MIALGCDHAGFKLKQEIINYLNIKSIPFNDLGTYTEDPVDYPNYAKLVCEEVISKKAEYGILICGTGIGISIAANRNKGIRAALCCDVYSAKSTRLHNNANILVFGGRVTGDGLAIEILETFLNTNFSNELKHKKRIDLIDEL